MYIYIDIYFHIYTYIAYEHSLSPQAQDKGILIGIKMDKVSPAPLSSESVSFRFKNKCFAEVWSSFEEGSHFRLIGSHVTQL